MKTDMFHLQIIPISDILPHEQYDDSRAIPLAERLRSEKMLINPILVAAVGNNKYLQLDGMNRFSACKMLGLRSIVAQIIDYNDLDMVDLASWVHMFQAKESDFLTHIRTIPGVTIKTGEIKQIGNRYIKETGVGRLVTIVSRDGNVYLVSSSGELTEKIDKLNSLVSYYKDNIKRDVLGPNSNLGTIQDLFAEHNDTNMVVIFPTFTRHQIIDIVNKGKLFPAGITRHIIQRRCLNVNVPIYLFEGTKYEVQNRELEILLSARTFRLYQEPTIYFE